MLKFKLALHTFLLYGLTFVLGIAAAYRHVIMPQTGTVAPLEPTVGNALIFILVFSGFTALIIRSVRSPAILRVLLLLALASGAQFIFSGWIPGVPSIAGALLVLLLLRCVPIVLVHDLAIALGIGGVSALMGLSITPLTAAVILALLSVYDIISVYRTRHMVALADRMIRSGAVFGFLVPARMSKFLMRTSGALADREVMMLGSGDIGLPLLLAASAVSTSVGAAVMVGIFALAGLLLMHWLFLNQKKPAPMAALPPIAMSAVLGYVLAILLGI